MLKCWRLSWTCKHVMERAAFCILNACKIQFFCLSFDRSVKRMQCLLCSTIRLSSGDRSFAAKWTKFTPEINESHTLIVILVKIIWCTIDAPLLLVWMIGLDGSGVMKYFYCVVTYWSHRCSRYRSPTWRDGWCSSPGYRRCSCHRHHRNKVTMKLPIFNWECYET